MEQEKAPLVKYNRVHVIGLCVAVAIVAAMVIERSAQPTLRKLASTKATAEAAIASKKLHDQCMQKNKDACITLVKSQRKFKLSVENVKYYESQACSLGFRLYCK